MNRYLIGIGALLALTACGGSDAPPKPAPSNTGGAAGDSGSAPAAQNDGPKADGGGAKPAGKQEWAASMGTATVAGKISFGEAAPDRATISMDSDPKCKAQPGKGLDETVVVKDGGLANVIVSVSKGLDGYDFGDGTGSVKIDQKGCQYIPHVIAMQAGQSIEITNSDDTVHNVHSYSKRNQAFNQAQPAGAAAIEKKMGRKDSLFPIKCDMHAWMNCHVAVFDHPFFTVSDDSGNFTLPKLPAGTYTVTAEHESLGKKTAEVTIADGGSESVTIAF